jgi:hypothetical protein
MAWNPHGYWLPEHLFFLVLNLNLKTAFAHKQISHSPKENWQPYLGLEMIKS